MENNNSLDPLGPEFGKLTGPAINSKSFTPFEGDLLRDNKIDYFPVTPPLNSTHPNYIVQDGLTGHAPGKPSIDKKNKAVSSADIAKALGEDFKMQVAGNTKNKNQYARINSYNAGPSGNSFYKRYAAYGQAKFDAIGFSPMRDNEAMFNAHTTLGDDFTRMMKNSFVPLFSRGFVSGPKSLIKLMQGDLSPDTEDARAYEEAAAIGQSSKKGLGAFFNNTAMSFAYTAGIISEAILEETAGALLAPETFGGSFFAATANNVRKIGKIGDALDLATDGYKAINNTIKQANNISGARKMWKAAENISQSKIGKFLNPLENTFDALSGVGKNADNLTGLARLSQATGKTAGGLFRDMRNINMALSEARLEGGMSQNAVYDKAYDAFYKKNGRAPSDEEQYAMTKKAKEAGMNTLMWNTALIFGSNKVVIPNVLKSGVSKTALQSKIDDVLTMKGGKITLEKTLEAGKKVTKGEFKYIEDSFKNSLKGFKKAPVMTTAKMVGKYMKANLMEGVQENLQDVISVANEKYYLDAYKNKELGAHLFNRSQSSLMYDGLLNQFSGQGFETFASGALMGLFSGGLNAIKTGFDYGYNKTFNKEKYQEYKDLREKHGKSIAKQLTALYNNPTEFFDSRVFNYGVQNNVVTNSEDAATKIAKDQLHEAFLSQVTTALETNTLNYFKDHIASFKDMSVDEFEEAFGFEKGKGAESQQKIDKILEKIDNVEKVYTYATDRFPDPVDLSKYKEGTPEYEDAALLKSAWKEGIRNYVFYNQSFMDVTSRMGSIAGSILNNKSMKKMSQLDMNLMLDPKNIASEIELLKSEVEGLKQSTDPNAKNDIDKKENRIQALQEFKAAHDQYLKRPKKAKLAQNIFEQIKQEQGIKDLTDEERQIILQETQDLFSEAFGDEFTQEDIDYIINLEKGNTQLEANLELAYKNYLKYSNGIDPSYIFNDDIDNSFELLKDHYTLEEESKRLVEYVNLLHDPKTFMYHVQKTEQWMRNMYNNREDYYNDMVNKQIAGIENNAFLNVLADMNIFIDLDEFQNFMDNGIPPKEFFDQTSKQVIPIGTERYNELFFILKENRDLKLKELSNLTIDEKLKYEIDKLDAAEKKEIDALDKVDTKVVVKNVKKKNIKLKDAAAQVNVGEYIDLVESKTKQVITLYSSEDGLRSDDENGDLISINDVTNKFSEFSTYKIEKKPNPVEEKEVKAKYNKLKKEAIDKYNAEKEKNQLDVYSIYTPVDKLPKDLYKKLQDAFNESDELASSNIDEYDDEGMATLFSNFIQKNPIAKEIIDDYNAASEEENEKQKSDEIDEFDFEYANKQANTSIFTLPQLIAIKNQLKLERNNEDDVVKKESLSNIINQLEKLISTRRRKNLTPAAQEIIKTLKETLIAQQKNIKKDGELGYTVNGVSLERVTNYIQQFKSDKYTYNGAKVIAKAFIDTIDKTELNQDSIDAFIDQLNTKLVALDNSGYTVDTIDGINSTSDNIRNYLEEVLDKKQKGEKITNKALLEDVQNFLSENAYEYTRKAGTYLDNQLRVICISKQP